MRRCRPVRALIEVRGAIASRVTIVLIDCANSCARLIARRGPRNIERTERTISAGSVMRSRNVSSRSCDAFGARFRIPLRHDGRRVLGTHVEQQRRDVDAGDAVDQRVMGLLEERDVAALESLDHPDLPERVITVEESFLHARRQRDELFPRSRTRQRGVAHVIRDVELVVVDPDRPALLVRHVHQPAPEPGQERKARQDEISHFADPEPSVGVEERRALEDAHRAHVHRVLGPLHVQEARVERGETVVVAHLRPDRRAHASLRSTGWISSPPPSGGSPPSWCSRSTSISDRPSTAM